jgi:hypothetical protein
MYTQYRHPPWEHPPKVSSLKLDSWQKDMPGRLLIIHSGWMLAACNMQTSCWEFSVSTNEKFQCYTVARCIKPRCLLHVWSATSGLAPVMKICMVVWLKLQLSSQDPWYTYNRSAICQTMALLKELRHFTSKPQVTDSW